MKKNRAYMVVETHSAYAVVLDNSGRFIKTANPGYEVGDTIDKVIPLLYPQDKKRRKNTIIRLAASLAACICLCAYMNISTCIRNTELFICRSIRK